MLEDYQERAWRFALYPGKGENLIYPALKLCEEASELCAAANSISIMKELGDNFWYVAAICTTIDVSFASLISGARYGGSFKEYGVYVGTCRSVMFRAGIIAGLVGKSWRDDEGVLTKEKEDAIKENLIYLVDCLVQLVDYFGFTMRQVLQENLDKLEDRHNRGVIKGSGDDR